MNQKEGRIYWTDIYQNKRLYNILVLLGIVCVLTITAFTYFLVWNENRAGVQLNDFVLSSFKSMNTSIPTFCLTYLSVILIVFEAYKNPITFIQLSIAITILSIMRMVTLTVFPLEPPKDIIPLRDFLLEGSFYSGQVLKKDLFFSGHTANIILFALITSRKWKRKLFAFFAICVGTLLLIQKVHYTIDVLFAPVFAFIAYKISKQVMYKLGRKTNFAFEKKYS